MYSVKFLSCLSLKQSVSMWSQSHTRTSSSKVRDKEVFKISKYVSTLLGLSQVPLVPMTPEEDLVVWNPWLIVVHSIIYPLDVLLEAIFIHRMTEWWTDIQNHSLTCAYTLLDALTEATSNVYINIYDRNVILTLRYKFVILFLFHRISVWDLGGQTSIRCWIYHVEIDDINMM